MVEAARSSSSLWAAIMMRGSRVIMTFRNMQLLLEAYTLSSDSTMPSIPPLLMALLWATRGGSRTPQQFSREASAAGLASAVSAASSRKPYASCSIVETLYTTLQSV